MTAVLFLEPTEEVEAWLAERQRAGLNIRDEVWEGTYVVMNPAPHTRHAWIAAELVRIFREPAEATGLRAIEIANIGSKDNYRIPDVTVVDFADADPSGNWLATAAVVAEIHSPGEIRQEKLPFYATRGVREVVLIDPPKRSVRWLALREGQYVETNRSDVLGLTVAEVRDHIRWD